MRPARVTPERVDAQILAFRPAPVRPWHDSARARHLIASCVTEPPVWERRWIAPAGRTDREEYLLVSHDERIAELTQIRWSKLDAIVSQGQTDKAKREFDRFARDTVHAVVTHAQDHAFARRSPSPTHLTAGGR